MNNSLRQHDEHVGDLLSGYLDGELTQQERQRVALHCESCEQCRTILEDLTEIRERMGKSAISMMGEDKWRENMEETGVQVSSMIGWVLFIIGMVLITGAVFVQVLFNDDLSGLERFMIFAIYGGLAALFVSVLRQRLIERKTDKYKDVEI